MPLCPLRPSDIRDIPEKLRARRPGGGRKPLAETDPGLLAAFAVHSIRRWWKRMGRPRFPKAGELLITANGGGSNSARSRLWKVSLQALADELGLRLHVCHFPPGTSKWNRIEHRLFSFITRNWRGRPLVSHQAVVNLIASTTTRTGLIVKAALDTNHYDTAVKVTDEQLKQLHLTPHTFHGDWNYMLTPHKRI